MKFCPDDAFRLPFFGMALIVAALSTSLLAGELDNGRKQFLAGDYEKCIKAAEKGIRDSNDEEEWHALLIQSLLTTGRYPEAGQAAKKAMADVPRSIRLRWLAREAFLANGQVHTATAAVEGIIPLIKSRPYDYRDGASLVALGQTALLGGTDPKSVLDQIFALAKKTEPKLRDVYLASGNLALE